MRVPVARPRNDVIQWWPMLTESSPVSYSVVVPLYNEQESVPQLYVKIIDAMDALGEPYEIVFVDDGSKDGTFRQLAEITRADERVVVSACAATSARPRP